MSPYKNENLQINTNIQDKSPSVKEYKYNKKKIYKQKKK